MCVTKCKQKKKMKSAKKNLSTPGTGGSVNPEMKSISHSTTAQSGEKGASKMAKVPSKEKSKGPRQSDRDAKDEHNEAVSQLKKIAEKASEMSHGPSVAPPRKLDAKRTVTGMKESKDPEYVTLDDDFPKFEKAILKGNSKEATETRKLEITQQLSVDEKKIAGSSEKTT
ncbi:uncharacterized protein CELE_ZC395.4 [Caenorhabditis elegans]|uniref:Uncharacterized protein n=1 Tax=Caenorhabditis elegans TaxID=6239 RepID=Q9GYG0_CAEEL|nr:Uncharacterized protein CELE_ZC395.4 [Caenorhabditis elegans]CCD66662.1 Uncharacterized protein CELE_ZC395.4 [Caenorhabditis elegans]|eukprot:NP_498125.1 Uncharacterized protein CELE_ZC395.4 [Caenorhabditis elegans]